MSANWYFAKGHEKMGPHAFDQLRQLLISGALKPDDMVWNEGGAKWVSACTVPGLILADDSTTIAPAPSGVPKQTSDVSHECVAQQQAKACLVPAQPQIGTSVTFVQPGVGYAIGGVIVGCIIGALGAIGLGYGEMATIYFSGGFGGVAGFFIGLQVKEEMKELELVGWKKAVCVVIIFACVALGTMCKSGRFYKKSAEQILKKASQPPQFQKGK